ncbi:ABC transporter permease [Wenjunlia vitaminophila]|uniref:ABC transporter permease n=1 Tax=Wenjunlia vitaminophila TaxID=76728 RepID=A0A0T6LKS6_WENVI|nr:carbohydrate ABC transporter permease [Wenjunlia vitaminophila]KRV46707.1 ABC transporter permease [Wenjunlia vitaminophila]
MTATVSTPSDRRSSGAAPAPARVRRRGQRSTAASVALHATLIGACLIAVFPVLFIFFISLKDRNGWQDPTGVSGGLGLDNYRHVLSETEFPRWFANSVIVACGTMVVGVFIAASAGYAISRMAFPGRRPLMWTFLVTQMFPVAVLIVPLYNILGDLGQLNTYTGLVISYCSVSVPFCAWMLKGYFDTIPVDIDEAGRVDGLTPFGVFYRLVLPLARPGLAVTAFYTFLTAWGEVAFARAFMNSEDMATLSAGLGTFVGQHKQEWGLMTAASIMITVPAGLVFFFAQKHLVSGLTAGGTKG